MQPLRHTRDKLFKISEMLNAGDKIVQKKKKTCYEAMCVTAFFKAEANKVVKRRDCCDPTKINLQDKPRCVRPVIKTDAQKKLSKFDLQEKRVLTFDVGENLTPGEPVFIPRPGATEEDDGVILATLVAESNDVQSALVILDAETFKEVARASVPQDVKMSFTFHGTFTNRTFNNNLCVNGMNGNGHH
ncbi:beta,beta-carotene 9',10'-oxygenase-like [Elysia marginata]|uniref:Beta,beta-carotene 9',10'-oxygenase-like n=1 Tax=Elysia marginata TaxID=1093978 RepID=A0AAV4G0S7_9GAST|nr:beta,beta-carotene 9',10'-oxygenase-like [Elysia marginata]